MAGWYIESEGDALEVSEEAISNLQDAGRIGDLCPDCSSEFSAQAVYHPAEGETLDSIQKSLEG